jgi:hypothetical protein
MLRDTAAVCAALESNAELMIVNAEDNVMTTSLGRFL